MIISETFVFDRLIDLKLYDMYRFEAEMCILKQPK